MPPLPVSQKLPSHIGFQVTAWFVQQIPFATVSDPERTRRLAVAFVHARMYSAAHMKGSLMTTLTFTDFRKRASGIFSDVEKGAEFVIVRHGRPIAELSPVRASTAREPLWKRPGLRLVSRGLSLSRAILDEREGG